MSSAFNQTIITIAAVCVSLLGNIINAVGYIIEKKAHLILQSKNAQLPASQQKSYAKDCLWISGFLTFALGSLLHAGALAFGPQSLLTPVTSITLVANTFLAHKYLHEPLRKQDIFGTILVVSGCIFAIIFGPRSSERGTTTARDLMLGFTRPAFTIFFTVLTFIVVADYIAVKIIQRKNSRFHEEAVGIIKKSFDISQSRVTITPNITPNNSDDEEQDDDDDDDNDNNNNEEEGNIATTTTTKVINIEQSTNEEGEENEVNKTPFRIYKGRTFLMLSYTSISAYWGAVCVLLTKSFGELIVSLFTSWDNCIEQLTSVGTYVIIAGFILANIFMEYWKQKALGLFGALYVIPIYQVEVIIGGILFGAMFFDELKDLSTIYLCLFIFAIFIDVVGVSVLASSTGIKEHIKVHNIVRRKLLVMKAINAFLTMGGIKQTKMRRNSFYGQLMNDDEDDRNAMINVISREAKQLQKFKDPELLHTGTGANDLHAMQAINEVESMQYQCPIGGVLAPVFEKKKHGSFISPPHIDKQRKLLNESNKGRFEMNHIRIPQHKTYEKQIYHSPPLQNDPSKSSRSQSVSLMDINDKSDNEVNDDNKENYINYEYYQTPNNMLKVDTISNTIDDISISPNSHRKTMNNNNNNNNNIIDEEEINDDEKTQ